MIIQKPIRWLARIVGVVRDNERFMRIEFEPQRLFFAVIATKEDEREWANDIRQDRRRHGIP